MLKNILNYLFNLIKSLLLLTIGLFLFLITLNILFLLIELPVLLTAKEHTEYDPSKFVEAYNYSARHAHYEPNTKITHIDKDFSYTFHITQKGFRESGNINRLMPMLCIGDSFTFGFGIEDRETFPSLLGAYNAGLFGWPFDVQLRALQRALPIVKPKIVVWQLYPSHLISMIYQGWKRGTIEINNLDKKPTLNVLINFYKSTAISRFIHRTFGFNINDANYYTGEWCLYNETDIRLKDSYCKLENVTKNICRDLKQYNTRPIVIIVPSKLQLSMINNKRTLPFWYSRNKKINPLLQNAKIREILFKNGFKQKDIIDLVNIFTEKDSIKKYYFRHDAHWNKKGHELVANTIKEHLAKWKNH